MRRRTLHHHVIMKGSTNDNEIQTRIRVVHIAHTHTINIILLYTRHHAYIHRQSIDVTLCMNYVYIYVYVTVKHCSDGGNTAGNVLT